VITIALGESHITKDRQVLGWGRNDSSERGPIVKQDGQDGPGFLEFPEILEDSPKNIICGSNYSSFLPNQDGWGNNTHRVLGDEIRQHITTPNLVK
jgi:hypothetical protein